MKVLVDTCVWSLALRRRKPSPHPFVLELRELINEGRVRMIGPIRQEILSGIRSRSQFELLRNHLRSLPDLTLTYQDHERAAEFFNESRKAGIQGSSTDFLICAVSNRHRMPILTTDHDFQQYEKHLPIKLLRPRPGSPS